MREEKPLLVEMNFRAKTYDVDYAGIVHNAVYIRWLEDLRLQIMDEHYQVEDQFVDNQSPVLAKTEIRYRWPLRLFEEALGQMWVSKLGKARWEVQATFTREDLIIASALQTGYFIDLKAYRPVRIPVALREKWEAESKS